MKLIRDAWAAADPPRGLVATIGNFDGLHRGQRAIVDRVVERAEERELRSAVVTFDPHPLAILRPAAAPPRLTTEEQKRRLLEGTGVDLTLVVRFTEEFSRVPARRFVDEFLCERLGVREVHVGSRFTFGRDREGDLALLRSLGEERGFTAFGVEEVHHDGEPISSTRIRAAVADGRVEEARAMLGRPYAIAAEVEEGEGRGHLLGWPTINLRPDNELLPADGVYTSMVRLAADGEPRVSVTNVGRRPTFHDDWPRVVESHILDFDRRLYGERLELDFHARLRGERTFAGREELEEQIGRDVAATREYFARPTR